MVRNGGSFETADSEKLKKHIHGRWYEFEITRKVKITRWPGEFHVEKAPYLGNCFAVSKTWHPVISCWTFREPYNKVTTPVGGNIHIWNDNDENTQNFCSAFFGSCTVNEKPNAVKTTQWTHLLNDVSEGERIVWTQGRTTRNSRITVSAYMVESGIS